MAEASMEQVRSAKQARHTANIFASKSYALLWSPHLNLNLNLIYLCKQVVRRRVVSATHCNSEELGLRS